MRAVAPCLGGHGVIPMKVIFAAPSISEDSQARSSGDAVRVTLHSTPGVLFLKSSSVSHISGGLLHEQLHKRDVDNLHLG